MVDRNHQSIRESPESRLLQPPGESPSEMSEIARAASEPAEVSQVDPLAVLTLTSSAALLGIVGDGLNRALARGDWNTLDYRTAMMRACGSPTDPVEVMLIDLLLWSHHRLAHLYPEAANCDDPAVAEMLHGRAARLTSEFRRTALALKQYRSPPPGASSVTVVQQTAAAVSDQSPASPNPTAAPTPEKSFQDPKLGSNGHSNGHVPDAASARRPPKSAAAPRSHSRRAPALA